MASVLEQRVAREADSFDICGAGVGEVWGVEEEEKQQVGTEAPP